MNRRTALAALLAVSMPDGISGMLGGLAWANGGEAGQAQARAGAFPLMVSQDRRCLKDGDGTPFLITGDAAWSLIAELDREEAEFYLTTRQQQGLVQAHIVMTLHFVLPSQK